MLTKLLFRRSHASVAAAAVAINPQVAFEQPYLDGLWEDSIGMRRFYISRIKKYGGYFVLDRAMRKSYHGDTLLTYLNDETTDIIFSAPWGPNSQMRKYTGNVSSCGTKIIWYGYNNNMEWHLLRGEKEWRHY